MHILFERYMNNVPDVKKITQALIEKESLLHRMRS